MRISVRTWILSFLLIESIHAENVNFAIVGGGSGSGVGYAGVLGPHSTTSPQAILLPPNTPSVRTVAINHAGICLIGCGNASGNSYAARILPSSVIPQTLNLPVNNLARGVAINNLGVGFVGCGDVSNGYAARIGPNSIDPQVINLPPGTNGIRRVAINDAGLAIIGGSNQLSPNTGYAAYVLSDSTTPQQIGGTDNINYVAINHAGTALIGGGDPNGYAAFFVPYNSTPLQTFTPSAVIYAVAINDAGIGIIGGYDGSNGYAAFVVPNSRYPQVIATNIPIWGADINRAGVGIIGGGTTRGYAALVAPDGTVTSLALPDTVTYPILDVAINDQGVSIIGGEDLNGNSYCALVAPNGTLTPLTLPPGSGVNFVAINDSFISSVGPYSSAVNTQLAAIYALETRLMMQKLEMPNVSGEIGYLLADANDDMSAIYREKPQRKKSIWTTSFGDHVHFKERGKIPSFSNEIGGILAALDYHEPDLLLGGALGYAFNYIHYGEGQGHGHLQEETACFYSAFKKSVARIQAVLWGGYYQVYNERHVLSVITSTAHFSGWILAPQVEIALPFALTHNRLGWIEPFVMMNWVNGWQDHFTEKGASGFNLVMKSLYSSLLQSELGLRFYEHFDYSWGRFSLVEKLSYVNQVPFHIRRANTYFLIPTSPFPIETGNSRIQNLGGIQLCGQFSPNNSSYPSGSLSFQGLLGSSYQSYFVNLEVRKNF